MFNQLMQNRAQGAIEYLLIIGAAILVVAIVSAVVINIVFIGQEQTSVVRVSDSFDSLKESSNEYVKFNGFYYLKSAPLNIGVGQLLHLNNSAEDSSGKGNSFTVVNSSGVTYSDGAFGVGLELDGAGSRQFSASGIKPVSSVNGFSVSVWVKGSPYPSGQDFLCNSGIISSQLSNVYYSGPQSQWSISQCIYGNLNKAVIWATDGTVASPSPQLIIVSSKLIRDDQWHNIVGTFSTSDNNVALYVDGVLQSSINPKTRFSGNITTSNVYISTNQLGGTADSFKGNIDEVIIWDRVLSFSEINEVYQNALEK